MLCLQNLRRMKLFYIEYKDDSIWPQVVAKLPWGHNVILIEKIKQRNVRMIYANAVIENGWSRSVLELQIERQYHKRIGQTANNSKKVLPPADSDLVNGTFKDPYIQSFDITLKLIYHKNIKTLKEVKNEEYKI